MRFYYKSYFKWTEHEDNKKRASTYAKAAIVQESYSRATKCDLNFCLFYPSEILGEFV